MREIMTGAERKEKEGLPYSDLLENKFVVWGIAVFILGVSFTVASGLFTIPAFILYLFLSFFAIAVHDTSYDQACRALKTRVRSRLWATGSLFSLASSFLGVVFAAPVVHEFDHKAYRRYGHRKPGLTLRQEGILAISGIMANVFVGLAGIMLAELQFFFFNINVLLAFAQVQLAYALTHVLPIDPLDGARIMRWNIGLWFFSFLLPLIFLLLIR